MGDKEAGMGTDNVEPFSPLQEPLAGGQAKPLLRFLQKCFLFLKSSLGS